MRLSTSFNVKKEKIHNWRDYLRLHCYPLEEFVPDWPSKPSSFKEVVSNYCTEVRELGFRLLGLISLGLGLEHDYIEKVLGQQAAHGHQLLPAVPRARADVRIAGSHGPERPHNPPPGPGRGRPAGASRRPVDRSSALPPSRRAGHQHWRPVAGTEQQ
ncbi:protein DOWNY MILDEW RESISTANCE 6 [Iris pallida]|uniref:Protein DOWNY MILDEW RESISTANCE 6 n=1 Tax=Iris pallida TaxID=29817 RepID=A0AAX6EYW8_IRIPA|nr:protein DOWNY MILDEW RESISTANCE 6 [Iris pallida]